MTGWRRHRWFDDTGLPWVPPSPNMPTLDTATVYPGGCLIEGTTLSEGRGTTRPFEQLGAPWVDGARLRSTLTARGLPGVRFREVAFRPQFQKHANRTCDGVFVHVDDRERFRPFETYLAMLVDLRAQDPSAFAWRSETYEFESDRPAIDLLLGVGGLREAVEAGATIQDLEASWAHGLESFKNLRARYLVYPD